MDGRTLWGKIMEEDNRDEMSVFFKFLLKNCTEPDEQDKILAKYLFDNLEEIINRNSSFAPLVGIRINGRLFLASELKEEIEEFNGN